MGRIILSICALVVAVALTGSGQGPGNSPGREAGTDKSNASASQNVQVTADLSRIASALEAQNANANTDREQRDLEAQEDMAKWAQAMFWAAAAQALLSAVGIALIYVTFRETHRAANSAAEIVTVTRESAERQLRAYIDIRDVVIVDFAAGKIPCAQGVLENAGSTPAHNIRMAHKLIATVDPSSDRVRDLLTNWAKTGASMGPRGITHLSNKATRALTAEEVASFNRGEWGWVVATAVSYRDVFGKLRRTISRGTGVSTGLLPNETVRVRLAHKGVRSN